MTESRDEFRQRISDVIWDGMERSEYDPEMSGRLVDGLEALYAQALRDLYEVFQGGDELSDICNHNGGAREVISRFASRRGICLEEKS